MSTQLSLASAYESVNKVVKRPVAQLIISGFFVLIILGLLLTPGAWYPLYGYYVPHWTYDGWGGPLFWGSLTKVEPSELAAYNNYKGAKLGEDTDFWGDSTYKADYSTCSNGDYQSPININVPKPFNTAIIAVNETLPDTGYSFGGKQVLGDYIVTESSTYAPYYYHDTLKFYCSHGHHDCGYLYWNPTGDQVEKYSAYYMMFHTPSEHSLDLIHFPMEMQVYYCTGDCKSANTKFVVVSVPFTVGDTNSTSATELQKLWGGVAKSDANWQGTNIYNMKNDKNEAIALNKEQHTLIHKRKYDKAGHTEDEIDTGKLYNLASGFYHYKGSMTTPPCKEDPTIDWLVQATPSHVSSTQWKTLYKLVGYPGNARPKQELFTRKINVYTTAPQTAFRIDSEAFPVSHTARPPKEVQLKHCSDHRRLGGEDNSNWIKC